jgi:HNH endonuclease
MMNTSASNTFFCIYTGEEVSTDQRSLEHIIPRSLGGPGTFGTSDVSAKANSDIGSAVDARLINHPFITIHRWRLQLKGQNGIVPGIDFPGTIDVNGRTMRVLYTINPDGTVDLKTRPEVNSDWAAQTFRVACDPKDQPEILKNITSKAVKKGIAAGPSDIRIQATNQTKLEKPTVSTNNWCQFTFLEKTEPTPIIPMPVSR